MHERGDPSPRAFIDVRLQYDDPISDRPTGIIAKARFSDGKCASATIENE